MELNLPRESVDVLILKSLSCGPKNAGEIIDWIRKAKRTTVLVEEGVLHPALHRLTRRRFAHARQTALDESGTEKVYELTPVGLRQLGSTSSTWRRHVDAIGAALAMSSSKAAW